MTLGSPHEKPVYVRLRETISDAILAGRFKDGDPLPSVRALAAEEQANPLTVAKAYQGFQDEARLRDLERKRFLTEEWPEVRERMNRLGIDAADLLDSTRA